MRNHYSFYIGPVTVPPSNRHDVKINFKQSIRRGNSMISHSDRNVNSNFGILVENFGLINEIKFDIVKIDLISVIYSERTHFFYDAMLTQHTLKVVE